MSGASEVQKRVAVGSRFINMLDHGYKSDDQRQIKNGTAHNFHAI